MVGLTAGALIGVMNPVITKLIELSKKKYENLKDVRKKITKLQLELSSMKTALKMVSESDEASPDVEEWMHQLRELSYDVEDCIEIFVHRLNHGDTCDGFIQQTISKLLTMKARYRIGNKIKELMEQVEEVSHRRNRYKDISSTSRSEHVVIDPRLHAVFEEANRLVGIDSQRDTVAASLTNGIDLHPQRMVVSIVGPGGLGKTTLANQVFQKIKSQFDCTAFVSVSRNPDVNEILSDAFSQVSENNSQTISEPNEERYLQLVSKIRDYLQNKRYLVIIDDIWSKEAWKDIQCAFPGDENASRIMATTRIQDVAESCCRQDKEYKDYVYPMNLGPLLHVKLQIFRVETSQHYPCFSRLPRLIQSLSSELTYLQIALERLGLEDMEVLERLSTLLYLNLHTTESTLEPLTISCSGFKSLKEFHYSHISGGLGPMFEEGAMPRIDTLGIRFAAHDKIKAGGVECDFGIRHLTSLKRLWVDIYCQGASTREVEAAEAAIKKVAALLPNSLKPKIDRWWEESMVNEDEN